MCYNATIILKFDLRKFMKKFISSNKHLPLHGKRYALKNLINTLSNLVMKNISMIILVVLTLLYKAFTPFIPSTISIPQNLLSAENFFSSFIKDTTNLFSLSNQELILYTIFTHFFVKFTVKLCILTASSKTVMPLTRNEFACFNVEEKPISLQYQKCNDVCVLGSNNSKVQFLI